MSWKSFSLPPSKNTFFFSLPGCTIKKKEDENDQPLCVIRSFFSRARCWESVSAYTLDDVCWYKNFSEHYLIHYKYDQFVLHALYVDIDEYQVLTAALLKLGQKSNIGLTNLFISIIDWLLLMYTKPMKKYCIDKSETPMEWEVIWWTLDQ